ncbi:MAG: glutamine-hydrolyzing carbamoyl-phosphate synthase small subunit [Candidatus Marinimicrobia bacterium]|nr:glutamine-hydrolyzing carbamoyl-phosphate synthase small subunit [Candidatus Neomarinimicrobiota bacterium]
MISKERVQAKLILQSGMEFSGFNFGAEFPASGEVVFNTGMVGYPESLTDPSYYGQILVLTYPLIGNYGIPENDFSLNAEYFESDKIQVAGLVVSEESIKYSHWQAKQNLSEWLKSAKVPAISGVDTRRLTQILREKGSMPGKIILDEDIEFYDPNRENIVPKVSPKEVTILGKGLKRVALLDCGCKLSIIRHLLKRDVEILRLPWDADISRYEFDGLLISNGPGNPKECLAPVESARYAIENDIPLFGICLGNQIIALAAGADTYKLKYGHRGQNQPVMELNTNRCVITSQNHGFAVDDETIPEGWSPWFRNLNDNTNEGIIHESGRFMSVQFHPEAVPGPEDADFIFDKFIEML